MTHTPAEALRTAWATYHQTIRALSVDGLTTEGLDRTRRDLRPGGIWQQIPPGYEDQARLLLHDIVDALIQRRPDMLDYYASDLLTPPDDLSQLDQTPGGSA